MDDPMSGGSATGREERAGFRSPCDFRSEPDRTFLSFDTPPTTVDDELL
jgi:hypothetical protein